MNKFYILILIISACVFASCKNKQRKEILLRPASMVFTDKDTTTISKQGDEYLQLFRNRNFAGCADLLYEVRNDSIFPLSDAKKAEYVDAMSNLPIYDAKMTAITLRDRKNNALRLTVQIIESGDLSKEIGVTHFFLNPVLKDGKWYLTLLDENAEGVEKIY